MYMALSQHACFLDLRYVPFDARKCPFVLVDRHVTQIWVTAMFSWRPTIGWRFFSFS